MTHTLLLKLSGPMQSWGLESRFVNRETGEYPTKSGIVGLLGAALGRRRTDPIEDLAGLRFGVRIDQPGEAQKDYQTAFGRHNLHKEDSTKYKKSTKIISRYYLHDAVFLAGIEAEKSLLEGLEQALKNPRYTLYLGRRACPANLDLVLGIRDGSLEDVLAKEEWHAADWYKKTRPQEFRLLIFRDAKPGESASAIIRDVPISFSQEKREYGFRDVIQEYSEKIVNDKGVPEIDEYMEAVISA